MPISRDQAATARAAARGSAQDRPSERRSLELGQRGASAPVAGRLQVARSAEGDTPDVVLEGYASVTEAPYEMYDMFGPYTEVVSAGAFAKTLGSNPDVKLLFNHRGMPLARTRIASGVGSLVLREDLEGETTGLHMVAQPAMTLPVAREVVAGIEAGLLDEMSFAFTITRGKWSPDYTEFRIDEVDINRGDVAVVTYGASPHTSVGLSGDTAAARTAPQTPSADARSVHARLQLVELAVTRA